jgi:hypothetical protein
MGQINKKAEKKSHEERLKDVLHDYLDTKLSTDQAITRLKGIQSEKAKEDIRLARMEADQLYKAANNLAQRFQQIPDETIAKVEIPYANLIDVLSRYESKRLPKEYNKD